MSTSLTELRALGRTATQLLTENATTARMVTRAKRLLALTTALAEVDTVDEVAQVVLDIGLQVVEARRAFIVRADRDELRMVLAHGYDEEMLPRVYALSINDPVPLTQSMRSGIPVYLSSVEEYRARYPWAYHRFGAVSETQAHAALPLVHRGAVVGGLGLSFAKPNAFGAADRTFTLLLAQTAGGALARAMSFDAERAIRRDAEMLARARAEALGVVAHDLRNPLSLIKNTAELLLESNFPAEKREQLLHVSVRAVKQMNRLIGDLLDVTRIEGGRLAVDRRDVDVRELIAEVDDTFRPLAAQRQLSWDVIGPAALAVASLDRTRVLQVLSNLIGNALKFTPQGGCVSLRVTTTPTQIVFAVADTGRGIPPDKLACLFEKFWQQNDDRRGIGLGLTIAKGIADAHGGRVDVASRLGEGSTFSLVLPRRIAEPPIPAITEETHDATR